MSNQLFKDYATSTAFSINLSKRMVEVLLELDTERKAWHLYSHFLTTAPALVRRGLVAHTGRDWVLTEAGEKVIPLLRLAGFKLKKINNDRIIRLPEPL